MERMTKWVPFLALGLAACSAVGGEEPLYVLRDSLGRSVALAGRSQLNDAAPGTLVRAHFGGLERELMVGEQVGQGPMLAARPAAVAGSAELPPVTNTPLMAHVTAEAAPPLATIPRRTARRARAAETATDGTDGNDSGRQRGPTSRASAASAM
jgi:hypothetical protein